MSLENEKQAKTRKRKNYPGELRVPGTKDYGVIMGNLMAYNNKLMRERDEQKAGLLFLKIAEKLKELGFESASSSVKKKAGRRKMGKFQDITQKKIQSVIETATKKWALAKTKHEEAKEKDREAKRKSFQAE